ncbi:hypothetical protein A1O1_06364 [Capronia coronata CBS 617.96]|uniref:Uncharacterized protein n=1 Tax=Capronia coronata CBS 617.96 TaxID=1182541 RepID=W9Y8N8_9EURO|nr:uncharacterized protein A1O1_06364 [Capronia coronata CBS 617.96]EXJ85995.1 hypothetical protein A1O1_06364 [Capronia coronata CBS 617.96]
MWSTAASWVALLALTAALTKYYNPELFSKITGQAAARPETKDTALKPTAKRNKTKRAHASRLDNISSGTSTPTSAPEGKASKRRKLISAPVDNTVVAETTNGHQVSLPRDEDGGMSNKEFAQQLAKAQAGTKLESSKSQGSSKKERRAARKTSQGNHPNKGVSGLSTEDSSTTGRDADDDLSPVGSPSTGPVSTAPTSRAGDVSDMLEAPAPKPTTLRLTDVKETTTKSAPKTTPKAFEPVLSKKQRQRQAKAAEQKALREEADRVHEAKKQQQLRTARLAEGTSNQTKANSFTAKQNPWQTGKPSPQKSVQEPPKTEAVPLLDTFDTGATPAVKSDVPNGAVSAKPLPTIISPVTDMDNANANAVRQEVGEKETNALAASSRERLARPALHAQASWADEVNEEEQDKWATELAGEEKWEPVTTKKGKKKVKKDNDTSSEASSSIVRPVTMPNKSVTNGTKENGVKPRIENVNRFQSIEPVMDPSFKDAEWEA